MAVRPAKTQISLGPPSLIWVFAGHTAILLVLSCRSSYLYLSNILFWVGKKMATKFSSQGKWHFEKDTKLPKATGDFICWMRNSKLINIHQNKGQPEMTFKRSYTAKFMQRHLGSDFNDIAAKIQCTSLIWSPTMRLHILLFTFETNIPVWLPPLISNLSFKIGSLTVTVVTLEFNCIPEGRTL